MYQIYVELIVFHIGMNSETSSCSQQILSFDKIQDANLAYETLRVQPTDTKIRRHVFKMYNHL